ncbi:DUF4097 family beta strand repeat-containing protein [Planosporangium thailandense]|nr:DUF4097 family beta strand repeat-containing protein [Planosporangium thailandense]
MLMAGGAGVATVVLLGGCGLLPDKEIRDERALTGTITTVAITGGSGGVTVSGSSDGSVHVKRRVRYSGAKPGSTDSVQGDRLVLNTSCGRGCSVDYEVTGASNLRVTGHNGSGNLTLTDIATASVDVGSGDIRVRGASGDVTARAGSGNIELSSIGGAVVTRTDSGNLRLTGVAGAAIAQAGSGNIDATGLRGSSATAHTGSGNTTLVLAVAQDVDAASGSGNVRVTVPGGQSYRVRATTSSGNSRVHVPVSDSAAHRITLHSGSGNVTVEQR